MSPTAQTPCIAFEGFRLIASGGLAEVVLEAKKVVDRGERGPVLVFDSMTSELIELDFRGSPEQVAGQLGSGATQRSRGRPRLGVVAREVTLLPRHWDWLATQPGGASAAVRRLVDAARQSSVDKDRIRTAKESAYRFISAMAGNEQGFEEATRALFAGDEARFVAMSDSWPSDVREHARALARQASA